MGSTENTIENTIANYFIIITRCGEFGTNYNPILLEITLAKMTDQFNAVTTLQSDFVNSLEATRTLINTREVLFKQMSLIVSRTISAFKASKASKNAIKDAKSLVNKIRGKVKKIKTMENGLPDPNHVSQSQAGFVNKVSNLEVLVKLYTNDGNYATNEDILKLTSLATLIANLKNANKAVEISNSETIKKRQLRNYALYEEENGIIDISLACKEYVKSVYGARSTEAKYIVGVPMKRIMRMKKAQETL